MGFMDKLSDMFGATKSTATDSVKPPSAVLKENGIDPSNLKFKFNQDGSVVISGSAGSLEESNRIAELVGEIPSISSVQNNIVIAAPEPEVVAEEVVAEEVVVEEVIAEDVVAEEVVVEEVIAEEAEESEEAGRTYTVQSGDTLWAISEKMYGKGGKYMKIFDANTSILDNPDKIRPGQKLVIPDLES